MTPLSLKPAGLRLASFVTAVNVLVAGAFAIGGIIETSSALPDTAGQPVASSVYAFYAAARAIPLALMVLAAIIKKDVTALTWLGALAGVIQVLDAGVGLVQHDIGKIVGPLVIAALQMVALVRLHRGMHDALTA